MSKDSSLVKRLIAFLKKPEALAYDESQPAHNPYDDYAAQDYYPEDEGTPETDGYAEDYDAEPAFVQGNTQAPVGASRLDALVMRAVQQFHAQVGYVIRHDHTGQMTYCTGRDQQGRYIAHTEVEVDRRAMFLALDSGESQLFVHSSDNVDVPGAVLCGPLWNGDQVVGVLYLDNPARSRLHRGVFDVFCDQAARMLADSVGSSG